jgi:hypothetical protein
MSPTTLLNTMPTPISTANVMDILHINPLHPRAMMCDLKSSLSLFSEEASCSYLGSSLSSSVTVCIVFI